MAKTALKHTELDVHRILDGPVRLNTAYGPVTVPQGHFVVNFPGEFELSAALPPDAFVEMFDLSDDERAEWGLPKADDEEANPLGDTNPPTKMTPTSTGPDAVIGVGGDFPPDRPDTLPQSPLAGSSIGPAATTPQGVYPPTDAQIRDWVAGHYAESYRERMTERLMGNRTRAADLLSRYPTASAETNEPPAPEAVIAPGRLVDPNADAAAPEQTAAGEQPPVVQMAGTTPAADIPGATDQPVPEAPAGAAAQDTGEGSFETPAAQAGVELAPASEPPATDPTAPGQEPSPAEG